MMRVPPSRLFDYKKQLSVVNVNKKDSSISLIEMCCPNPSALKLSVLRQTGPEEGSLRHCYYRNATPRTWDWRVQISKRCEISPQLKIYAQARASVRNLPTSWIKATDLTDFDFFLAENVNEKILLFCLH